MIRNLKVLGLALVAVLALGAMAASAAYAEEPAELTTEGTVLSGSQSGTHKFIANGNEVTCKTATFTGTTKNGDREPTVKPTYNECHIIIGFTFNATVTNQGCSYKFTDFTTAAPEYQGKVDIESKPGKSSKSKSR